MKRILNKEEAEEYVGGRLNLQRLIEGKLVRAIGGKKRDCDYDVKQLDQAVDIVVLKGWDALGAEVGV